MFSLLQNQSGTMYYLLKYCNALSVSNESWTFYMDLSLLIVYLKEMETGYFLESYFI